jgi:hypothetical protein
MRRLNHIGHACASWLHENGEPDSYGTPCTWAFGPMRAQQKASTLRHTVAPVCIALRHRRALALLHGNVCCLLGVATDVHLRFTGAPVGCESRGPNGHVDGLVCLLSDVSNKCPAPRINRSIVRTLNLLTFPGAQCALCTDISYALFRSWAS